MRQNISSEKSVFSIQIPSELGDRLLRASASQSKDISVMVREFVEEKLAQIERRMSYEDKMKLAYLEMAEENLRISEDFRYADAENIG